MNEYSIEISNGKVSCDSAFYIFANDLLSKECKRLCGFTDELDKDTAKKKEHIAEYKCAKFRYSTVSLIHSILQNNNRCRKQADLEGTHYLLEPFDKMFKAKQQILDLYESALRNEKPDFSLYYMLKVFIENEITNLTEKLTSATDWEKVELEERIGGLKFAEECLNEAWSRRKDVIK